ncbi:transmembrane protein 62-like [Trichogramma pretiosum]|uniref:transmembrane protein 62-like n=1 Tax=Trichogramma pretiosum TaxID=7493 RepID=UPI0006C9E319|nr:transmembrane protein 62-like [Trichogramma pretiosum]XP_014232231.1 transmembrane protein 62-like [Trichogramma pretiosum]
MKISKLTLLALMFAMMLSIFVANLANIIDYSQALEPVAGLERRYEDRPREYDIGGSYDRLMWFVQITDIHISIFRDPLRITELKEFCDVTVGAIKPQVVLASGDLTDAKTLDKMGSRQFVEEWVHYKKVLDDSRVTEKTTWLDVRGNHDNFNVYDEKSKENYFANYSIQGGKHPRSYMHQVRRGSELYSFVAMDACLKPGPKRPFNFVGALDEQELATLRGLMNESRKSQADHVVWFGHYPTSCIVAPYKGGARAFIGSYEENIAYLCGHFHTLGGSVPNMYSLQKAGFLELELADWKDNRMYRLGVIDHGQFSFVDIDHRDWPVALVTNPKNAQFVMPRKEKLQSIIDSTHIRVLAFSIADIKSVRVKINNGDWIECDHVEGPLYVTNWNTSDYKTGIHDIHLKVVDDEGREKTITQPFSLDGSRLAFRILPRILLMYDIGCIFQMFFLILFVMVILPLCILRICHHTLQSVCGMKGRPKSRVKLFNWWLRSHWILATVDRLFFPLVLYAVYLLFGPWIIGEIIDNHTGVVFAWGTYVGKAFLPGSFTYAYGFFQLLSFHLPLTIMVAHRVNKRLQSIENPETKSTKFYCKLWEHVPFIFLILLQLSMIYFFWLAYGTIAAILCPLRTWSMLLAFYLWYQVYKMPRECLRSAAKVWCKHGCFEEKSRRISRND